MPCIREQFEEKIDAISGTIHFLGIFGLKTYQIIGHKSRNSAPYYKRISTPPQNSICSSNCAYNIEHVFCLFCPIILRTHFIISQKSALCYSRYLRKIYFLGFFTSNCIYYGTFSEGLKVL